MTSPFPDYGRDTSIHELGTSRATDRRDVLFDAYERMRAREGSSRGEVTQVLLWRDTRSGEWLATTTVFPMAYRP